MSILSNTRACDLGHTLAVSQLLRLADSKLGKDGPFTLNPATQYYMASQVADGLAYLALNKYVHRDIAARNILINDRDILKISDFGLGRDVYASDYYRKTTAGALPLRWMAPESVLQGVFTVDSDMWMFGCLVWEIMTFAEIPWPGVSDGDIIENLRRGEHMVMPKPCEEAVETLLELCWRVSPQDRISAADASKVRVLLDPSCQTVVVLATVETAGHRDLMG